MTEQVIIAQLNRMPEALKREVLDFIGFLMSKYNYTAKKKTPVFGSAKGKYELSPDFDEPLEDFKDYM